MLKATLIHAAITAATAYALLNAATAALIGA